MSNSLQEATDAAAGLTEEQIADLKEAFAMFDINGDGTSQSSKINPMNFSYRLYMNK